MKSASIHQTAFALAAVLLASVAALPLAHAETPACVSERATIPVVHYRTVKVDGVDVFYREAGPAGAPTVLLLHGFPTSSHMFRNLIPALADRYHVIAPDYPGFWRERGARSQDICPRAQVRGARTPKRYN